MSQPTDPTDPASPTGPTGPADATPSTGAPAPYAEPSAPPAAQAAGPAAPATSEGVDLADPTGEQGATGAPRRRRTGLVVGAIAATVVLAGGAAFAATRLSGGGAQPADVLPGDAYAYVRLDIDPSAGQKIAAVRFLGSLPKVKDTLGSDDPRRKVWELLTQDASDDCVAKIKYDTDVEPWLGDRAGLALRPGGTEKAPNLAIAVQVEDEAKAKDALGKLLACSDDGGDVVTRDGYALVMPKGTSAATTAAVDKGTLADNPTFVADMSALGEQGVASMWFDMGTGVKDLAALSGQTVDLSMVGSDAKGRVAAAVRFDSAYVELAGVVRGGPAGAPSSADATQLSNLPDDTAVAVQASGVDQSMTTAWPQLKKQLDTMAGDTGEDPVAAIEQQLGVSLPKDLGVLLGRSFTLAMPGQTFGDEMPAVGAKVVSSDAGRADEIVGRVEQVAGAEGMLTRKVAGDTLYVATTPDYAARLQTGGTLGRSEVFTTTMGDVSKASMAIFVDLDKLEKNYLGDLTGDEKTFAQSLRSVGMSARSTGDGSASFTVRLVGN